MSWINSFQVGLPAKSGVSGGILLVVPNIMGVFMWSPALDTWGNSVRGVQFCEVDFRSMVNVLKFCTAKFLTKWHMQTVQTQIRLLLQEQSYQGLFCLPLH